MKTLLRDAAREAFGDAFTVRAFNAAYSDGRKKENKERGFVHLDQRS